MGRLRGIWILALALALGCGDGEVKDAAHGVDSAGEDGVDATAPEDLPPPCEPSCDGRECGPDDCGGTCGFCPEAAPLCEEGACLTVCTPVCDDVECGPDGCGGACGTCPDAAPVCEDGACLPVCESQCDGLDCGPDGCDGACGFCGEDEACEAGLCVEICVPDCADLECGWDGCDGVCGDCIEGALCDDGICVAASGEKWLANETFDGAADAQPFPAEVVVGDVLGASFAGGVVDYPFRVKTLLFRLVSNPTFPGASCAPFHVRIWREINVPEPQELLFDSEVAGLGPFDLPGDGGPALVDLLTLGVEDLVIETGAIRVGIVPAGYTCEGSPSNLKVPVPFRVPDAASDPATNWFHGAAAPGEPAAWHDAAGLGVEGNFVFRVLVDYGYVAPE